MSPLCDYLCYTRFHLANKLTPGTPCWLDEVSGHAEKGHVTMNSRGTLGAEGSRQLSASKKPGSSVLQLQGNEICQ